MKEFSLSQRIPSPTLLVNKLFFREFCPNANKIPLIKLRSRLPKNLLDMGQCD